MQEGQLMADEKQIDRVIEFLSKCDNADIRVGIDALRDSGPKEKFAKFRRGLEEAIGPGLTGG